MSLLVRKRFSEGLVAVFMCNMHKRDTVQMIGQELPKKIYIKQKFRSGSERLKSSSKRYSSIRNFEE